MSSMGKIANVVDGNLSTFWESIVAPKSFRLSSMLFLKEKSFSFFSIREFNCNTHAPMRFSIAFEFSVPALFPFSWFPPLKILKSLLIESGRHTTAAPIPPPIL